MEKEIIDIDEALERIPMGLFQYRMLLMCGFAFMADALEVNLLSFLATCAGAEWNLSNTEKASITGIVFIGIIIGSLWWGSFADRKGRKTTFILVAITITTGGFITGLAPSFPVLLAIRSIVGFGIGGANIPFDLLAEFMPSSHRGYFLIYIQYFWTVGSMFVTGLAWLFLDNYGWRTLAILTAIPVALTSLMSLFFLPESPRWLLINGKSDEAVEVIRQCSLVNGHSLVEFALKPIHENAQADVTSYSSIVLNPSIRNTVLPLALIWMLFGLTYYGIILFVSRIYSITDDDAHSNAGTCEFDYSSIFYNSLAELGGVTLSAFFASTGRVRTQSGFYIISGVAVLFMGLIPNISLVTMGSVLARMAVMAASNATWLATPELLPTEIRTFGHAICISFSKFGSFIAPYIVISNLSNGSISVILSVFNGIAALLAFTLRETVGSNLDDPLESISAYHLTDSNDTSLSVASKFIRLNPLHENERLVIECG